MLLLLFPLLQDTLLQSNIPNFTLLLLGFSLLVKRDPVLWYLVLEDLPHVSICDDAVEMDSLKIFSLPGKVKHRVHLASLK